MIAMKQKPIMPKEHFDAIAAQLGSNEELRTETKTAARNTGSTPKHETPKVIEHSANYKDSMRILNENSLNPLTYHEALVYLTQDLELKEKLKGKMFYLEGHGIQKEYDSCTFNKKGELVELTGSDPTDQKVCIWPGNEPLLLYVTSDGSAWEAGRQFDLHGNYAPGTLASVVVGVRKNY